MSDHDLEALATEALREALTVAVAKLAPETIYGVVWYGDFRSSMRPAMQTVEGVDRALASFGFERPPPGQPRPFTELLEVEVADWEQLDTGGANMDRLDELLSTEAVAISRRIDGDEVVQATRWWRTVETALTSAMRTVRDEGGFMGQGFAPPVLLGIQFLDSDDWDVVLRASAALNTEGWHEAIKRLVDEDRRSAR